VTQGQTLRKLRQKQWRAIESVLKQAYQEGFQAGLTRAHGQGRRGRTIRGDATVAGLQRRIERHFGLNRYAFEIRVVHPGSGRRIPAGDLISRYPAEP
jgi:hypothetical protein